MTAYQNLYYYLEGTFDGCKGSHISRANNKEADNLANIGSQCFTVPPGVFWEEITERSIKGSKTSSPRTESTAEPVEVIMIEETWMEPYLAYMMNKTLPEDTVEARSDVG
jgi:hypothetical protein